MRYTYIIPLTVSVLIPQIANAGEPDLSSYAIVTKYDWTEISENADKISIDIEKNYFSNYDAITITGFDNECFAYLNNQEDRIEVCTLIEAQGYNRSTKVKLPL